MQSRSLYSRLTRLQRITLVLFIIVLFNWLMRQSTGYTVIGGDLLNMFFLASLGLLGLSFVPPIARRVIVRRRNRMN